jgi:hypothetical protein
MKKKSLPRHITQWVSLLLVTSGIFFYSGCSKDDDKTSETCSDGIQNQGETGVDCGGPCSVCPTCSDGIQNQGETGIDCGGPCSPCPLSARDSAAWDYNTNYLGSAVTYAQLGWTGDDANCIAGSVPLSTDQKVIKRINYFRRIVGLNDNTTLDTTLYQKYREAALMMKANNALSHTPPTSWYCYTTLGYQGANTSNLALGAHAADAVTLFINDYGTNNFSAGHRRWILHSAKTKFSYGTTDYSMSLGVIGLAGGNTQIPEYIAYPPSGYIPRQLVFGRWSFGIPGGGFNSANVIMTGPSGSVSLTVNTVVNGYGDNTIVWEPSGINTTSSSDITYHVTISGITGAPNSSYSYDVTIINP